MTTESQKRRYLDSRADTSISSMLPPQALDIEEVVLGALMLESNVADKVMQELSANLFYKEKNQWICQAILELYKESTPIDIVTVTQHLRKVGKLDDLGGAYIITQLTNRVASSANIEFYVKILQQESLKRSLITISSQTIKKAYMEETDVFDLYQEHQIAVDDCLKDVLHYDVEKVGSIHDGSVKESIKVQQSGGISGVKSKLTRVDRLTNGWQKTDFIIIAGRPGMGKTALMVSMAKNTAVDERVPTAIFSLEMSKQQLVGRIQAKMSRLDASAIIKKQLTYEQIDYLDTCCKPLYEAPLFIDDTPSISLLELKSKARRLVREHGVQLILIDYLQLMTSGKDIKNREQEIADISRGLKGLAKELNIPVIALSQLSRGVETRGEKKPMLSDLRESGQIEQDADMVAFCYRPEYYGLNDRYEGIDGESHYTKDLFVLIIAKHRNGPVGEIPLTFRGAQIEVIDHTSSSAAPPPVVNNAPETAIEPNSEFLQNNKPGSILSKADEPF